MKDETRHVAGFDLDGFVQAWVAKIEKDPSIRDGYDLIAHRHSHRTEEDEYLIRSTLLLSKASAAAIPKNADPRSLLLFAAISLEHKRNSSGRHWRGNEEYVWDCFDHLDVLGTRFAAHRLITDVLQTSASTRSDRLPRELRAARTPTDNAESAAHDRQMAEIWHRDIRAGLLLDPTLDFDQMFLGFPSSS